METIRDKIKAAVAFGGRPMTSKEVYAACKDADDVKQVSDHLGAMYRQGRLVDRKKEANGRFVYWIPEGARAPSPPAPPPGGEGGVAEEIPTVFDTVQPEVLDGMLAAAERAREQRVDHAPAPAATPVGAIMEMADRVPASPRTPRQGRCAVFSDGTLLIERAGGRVELTRDEAAMLRAYLLQIDADLLCA